MVVLEELAVEVKEVVVVVDELTVDEKRLSRERKKRDVNLLEVVGVEVEEDELHE